MSHHVVQVPSQRGALRRFSCSLRQDSASRRHRAVNPTSQTKAKAPNQSVTGRWL